MDESGVGLFLVSSASILVLTLTSCSASTQSTRDIFSLLIGFLTFLSWDSDGLGVTCTVQAVLCAINAAEVR